MVTRNITIANKKDDVCKTTTVTNLAHGLPPQEQITALEYIPNLSTAVPPQISLQHSKAHPQLGFSQVPTQQSYIQPTTKNGYSNKMTNTNRSFQDEALLSVLVSEAFAGVDITRRYPALYRILLADPNMQEAFLDALETLEQERNGTLEPLPDAPYLPSELLGNGQQPVITPDDIKMLLGAKNA